MKVVFDTSSLLNLLNNDEWVNKLVAYFDSDDEAMLYLVRYVREELDIDRLSSREQRNYERLQDALTDDDDGFFILGVSTLNGGDVLRGDGAERLGIEQIFLDKNAAYEESQDARRAKGLPPVDIRTWLRRNVNQNDSVIFERAEQLGCDYVISDNKHILRAKNTPCEPLTLSNFIAVLNAQ